MTAALERLLRPRTDLTEFHRVAGRDPRLDDLATRFRGAKPPCFPTVFEAMLNAIAGAAGPPIPRHLICHSLRLA